LSSSLFPACSANILPVLIDHPPTMREERPRGKAINNVKKNAPELLV